MQVTNLEVAASSFPIEDSRVGEVLSSQLVPLLDLSLGPKVSKLPNVRPLFKASGTWKWFGKVTCCLNSAEDCTQASEIETSVTLAVSETYASTPQGIIIDIVRDTLERTGRERLREKLIDDRNLGNSGFVRMILSNARVFQHIKFGG